MVVGVAAVMQPVGLDEAQGGEGAAGGGDAFDEAAGEGALSGELTSSLQGAFIAKQLISIFR